MSGISLNNVKYQLEIMIIYIKKMTVDQVNSMLKDNVPEIKDDMIR
jgi:hypothetical protein